MATKNTINIEKNIDTKVKKELDKDQKNFYINPYLYVFIFPCSLTSDKIDAKNKINPIFANSDGWKLKPAILIHRLAPPASIPTNPTSTNKTIKTM